MSRFNRRPRGNDPTGSRQARRAIVKFFRNIARGGLFGCSCQKKGLTWPYFPGTLPYHGPAFKEPSTHENDQIHGEAIGFSPGEFNPVERCAASYENGYRSEGAGDSFAVLVACWKKDTDRYYRAGTDTVCPDARVRQSLLFQQLGCVQFLFAFPIEPGAAPVCGRVGVGGVFCRACGAWHPDLPG